MDCINRSRTPEIKKVIVPIFQSIGDTKPGILHLFIGTTQFREGRLRLRVKSVFKCLKGDHVGGRLEFYFGPWNTTRTREAVERALRWRSDRPEYKSHRAAH